MKPFAIAIHGGAGTIPRNSLSPEKELEYTEGLNEAVEIGYSALRDGKSALDAVRDAVVVLENNPLFNAGKGSVFNHLGLHDMDAAIMCGKTLDAGAVSGIGSIKNPVILAETILKNSEHVMLIGVGAEEFARLHQLEFADPGYFYDEFRHQQWKEALVSGRTQLDHTLPARDKMGTVGAVALDQYGNLAAATSTGGMTNKKFGRVGDSSIIGAGNYANNLTCAISCTGHGEPFLRAVTAYDVSCLMEYKDLSLHQACSVVVHEKLPRLHGDGGLIAADAAGNVELIFNSDGMYRAMRRSDGSALTAIYG
jgi:beta-aspartyl-peptidase (threonine type)